jgi:hypothetical protein
VDDGIAIYGVDGGRDALLQFLFGRDADVTQHGAGELGEEALDEIEPGAVLGSEDEGEAPFGSVGQFFGYRLFVGLTSKGRLGSDLSHSSEHTNRRYLRIGAPCVIFAQPQSPKRSPARAIGF